VLLDEIFGHKDRHSGSPFFSQRLKVYASQRHIPGSRASRSKKDEAEILKRSPDSLDSADESGEANGSRALNLITVAVNTLFPVSRARRICSHRR
jgi:hypothetical protein